MKRLVNILFISVFSLCTWADVSQLQIGGRGGFLCDLSHKDIAAPGAIGMVDINYTYSWQTLRSIQVGIRTGLNMGYSQSNILTSYQDAFVRTDYLNNNIEYTLSCGKVKELQQQVEMEIPVQLVIHSSKLAIHFGPKIAFSVWNMYNQELSDIHIDAYYPVNDVHVRNELITGKLDDPSLLSGTYACPIFSLLLSTEVGYEWKFRNNRGLGLSGYIDVSPWSFAQYNKSQSGQLIEIDPISNAENPAAPIRVNSMSQTTNHYVSFSAGIRLYYIINFKVRSKLQFQ